MTTAQQRHQAALDRIDRQAATVTNQVLVAHQIGLPDRDIHAANPAVLQGRRRIVERHAPHPDRPHWCTHCTQASSGVWGGGWPRTWPCPDWADAACEDTPVTANSNQPPAHVTQPVDDEHQEQQ